MRNLIHAAVVMASRRERGGGGGGQAESGVGQAESETHFPHAHTETETQTGPITDAQVGSPANGQTDTVEVKVDSDGVVHGEGYDPAQDIETDVVALPTKLVAKDIVGRAALKCAKRFIAEKSPDDKPLFNEDGSPKGVWEVTPPTPLYTVFGTANGTETGETQYGAWTGFLGDFEARRTADGKRFKSNRLILQEPAQSLLVAALARVKQRDAAGSVSFAFNVGKKTSQRWVDTGEGSSYEYTIESIINVVKHDPLAHLRKALLPHFPKPPASQLTGPTSGSTP